MATIDDRWYLVCYDVRDAKRLRRCAKFMEGHGSRIQYSVFRCRLTKTQAHRLQWELTQMLKPEDEVQLIPICDRCASGTMKTHSTTRETEWNEEPPTHTIV